MTLTDVSTTGAEVLIRVKIVGEGVVGYRVEYRLFALLDFNCAF